MKKKLLDHALKTKLDNLHRNGTVTHTVYDKLIFNQTKAALGGRCRVMITGSAPIRPEILDFLKVTLCAPVIEGYG